MLSAALPRIPNFSWSIFNSWVQSLDSGWKLMSRRRRGVAAESTWLISCVRRHCDWWSVCRWPNLNRNLPSSGWYRQFSSFTGFLRFCTKNKKAAALRSMWLLKAKRRRGTNYSFRSRAHKQADVGNVLIKRTYTHGNTIKNAGNLIGQVKKF